MKINSLLWKCLTWNCYAENLNHQIYEADRLNELEEQLEWFDIEKNTKECCNDMSAQKWSTDLKLEAEKSEPSWTNWNDIEGNRVIAEMNIAGEFEWVDEIRDTNRRRAALQVSHCKLPDAWDRAWFSREWLSVLCMERWKKDRIKQKTKQEGSRF